MEGKQREQQFLLSGLHCAGCVHRVEKAVSKLPEVEWVSVNLVDQTAFVQGNVSAASVIGAITQLGFEAQALESEEARREKHHSQMAEALRQKKYAFILALSVGAMLMLYGILGGMRLTEQNKIPWLLWAAVTLATLFISGKHFFVGAWSSLKNYTSNMDTLIALSTGVAFLYSLYLVITHQLGAYLYFEASVMIIGFLNLGKYLEMKAKQSSSLALEALFDLAPQHAVMLSEGIAKTIPVKAIKPKMRIQALAGNRLAVDGVLESGALWVDESMLTGEPLPVEKNIGDKVRAGTLIQDGAGVYIAEQVGEQTVLARIMNAVRYAQSSKPLLAKWVDKIAAWFVPVVLSIALVSSAMWLAFGKEVDFAISIFTTVLIIACPCALGLAIPLSTIAGVTRAAEFGVLVRNIEALQAASLVDTLVFDKTGTLTTGEMSVTQVQVRGDFDKQMMLRLVKSLESQAIHPIAKALVKFCDDLTACEVSDIHIAKGLGISAIWQGKQVRVGNEKWLNLPIHDLNVSQIGTQVFVAIENELVGAITLQDQLRPESAKLIQQFQTQGYQCLMLTGDNQAVAEYYAQQLGLTGVIAEVLPEQKAAEIVKLQSSGKRVAMIGDGINDAPALAQANVGIAMYGGSEVALETADLSLMRAGLEPLGAILPFSKRVLANMKQSLVGAFIYNLISIPIAAGVLYSTTGWLLDPMISAIAMALSSVTVVLNSQRLLRP